MKVLEFTEIIAGPFAGMLLGDMGAKVIKVEPPWGEPWRFAQEIYPDESRMYMALNRGKRSLPLDLNKPEGREIVYKLVPDMDVVIINARPDVPAKLGIDYETLSARNPRLIYCENIAFGRKGPHRSQPGYDIVLQAMAGLMASEAKLLNGIPQQVQSSAIADFASGIALAWGICAALYYRQLTSKGQKIEATLLGSALAVQTDRFLHVSAIDDGRRAEFQELLGYLRESGASYEQVLEHYRELDTRIVLSIYYRAYQVKDGVIAIGCLSDRRRKQLLGVLGLDDIRFHPGYDPRSPAAQDFAEQLADHAEAIFRQRPVAEWMSLLDQAGVPAGPVQFTEELVNDEQVVANDLVVELQHSVAGKIKMVGPLLNMSETPLQARSASPALGQHTDEVLAQLGYSTAEIQRLRDSKVMR